MEDNILNKKSFLTQLIIAVRSNTKNIIITISLCFIFFLFYQIYSLYLTNKIKNNSIVFFDNQNSINQNIIDLSNESGFYGILSKLDIIKKYIQDQNYEEAKGMYFDLLSNKKLDKTYKSAIASKAAFEFIDINFSNLSKNYLETVKTLISFIDNEVISYRGIKLELEYLVAILNIEINNLNYLNNNEAIDLFNDIMSSDLASSSTRERVNKIHEFFSYQ